VKVIQNHGTQNTNAGMGIVVASVDGAVMAVVSAATDKLDAGGLGEPEMVVRVVLEELEESVDGAG
jgi:hypothetical protein